MAESSRPLPSARTASSAQAHSAHASPSARSRLPEAKSTLPLPLDTRPTRFTSTSTYAGSPGAPMRASAGRRRHERRGAMLALVVTTPRATSRHRTAGPRPTPAGGAGRGCSDLRLRRFACVGVRARSGAQSTGGAGADLDRGLPVSCMRQSSPKSSSCGVGVCSAAGALGLEGALAAGAGADLGRGSFEAACKSSSSSSFWLP
mmetsp:Transcript_9168/g.31037  ORF Transcript_9168/g.31037 Transcript_9168/m.31037 type:complete len:204 (+) Transcript_9168:2135-2746(+)